MGQADTIKHEMMAAGDMENRMREAAATQAATGKCGGIPKRGTRLQ